MDIHEPQSETLTETITFRPVPPPEPRFRMRHYCLIALLGVTILGMGIAAYPLLPRKYTSSAAVWVRLTDQEGHATGDQSIRDQLDDNAIQTKIDLLASAPLQQAIMRKHDLTNDPEFNPMLEPSWMQREVMPWLQTWLPDNHHVSVEETVQTRLAKNLIVRRDRKSYLLQIGYVTKDPQKSADLANSLVETFFTDAVARKRAAQQRLIAGLQQRVNQLRDKARDVEQRDREYLTTTGLIHRGANDSSLRQLTTLSDEVANAHTRALVAANRAEMLANMQRSGSLDNSSEALSSPLLQHLRERLVGLTTGAGTGSSPVAAGLSSSVLNEFRQGINAETVRIVKAAQNDANVAERNESGLRLEIQHIDDRMIAMTLAERRGEMLRRESLAVHESYGVAMRQLMDETGRENIMQPDADLVSAAVPPVRQSFPDPLLYMGGLLTFAGLAMATVIMARIKRVPHR